MRTSARFAIFDQQQLTDFLERNTETLCATDELQPVDGAFVVDPISSVGALSQRYEALLLVEANGANTQSCALGDLSDLHGGLNRSVQHHLI